MTSDDAFCGSVGMTRVAFHGFVKTDHPNRSRFISHRHVGIVSSYPRLATVKSRRISVHTLLNPSSRPIIQVLPAAIIVISKYDRDDEVFPCSHRQSSKDQCVSVHIHTPAATASKHKADPEMLHHSRIKSGVMEIHEICRVVEFRCWRGRASVLSVTALYQREIDVRFGTKHRRSLLGGWR